MDLERRLAAIGRRLFEASEEALQLSAEVKALARDLRDDREDRAEVARARVLGAPIVEIGERRAS